MPRRRKFTVGLWLDLKTAGGQPSGFQMWNIYSGEVQTDLKWATVILALNEDEALKLAQEQYAVNLIGKRVGAA